MCSLLNCRGLGSGNQASDWPNIKPIQVISEPDKPQNSEGWNHAFRVFGGKDPFPGRLNYCSVLCACVSWFLKSEISTDTAWHQGSHREDSLYHVSLKPAHPLVLARMCLPPSHLALCFSGFPWSSVTGSPPTLATAIVWSPAQNVGTESPPLGSCVLLLSLLVKLYFETVSKIKSPRWLKPPSFMLPGVMLWQQLESEHKLRV